MLHRQDTVMSPLVDHVAVTTAWEAEGLEFSGTPPHIKSLVDIAVIKRKQSNMVEAVFKKVMDGMVEYFDEKEIGGGNLTAARIKG